MKSNAETLESPVEIASLLTEPLAGKKVLLAEDDEVSQQQLSILLARMGATVEIVTTGEQVLEKMLDCQCDMLFLDLHLPPFNTMELVRTLRKEHGLNIPILGLSAADMGGRAINAGVNHVLRKPLEVSEIKSAIFQLQEE